MLDFMYDSLETVKKLRFPTKKEFINLTIGTFLIVLIASVFFVVLDTVFAWAHQAIHNAIMN